MVQIFLRTVFLPVFLVGGVALGLVVGPLELVKAKERRGWPTVEGSITHANIDESLGRKGREYRPVIQYRYQVEGRQYESDVVSSSGTGLFTDRSKAEALLEEVSAGGAPVVHYNPERPEQALLSLDSLTSAWAVLGTGIALLFGTAWIVLRLGRTSPKPQSGAAD